MAYKEFGATIAPANKSDTGFPIAMGSHIGGGRTINGITNLKLWQLLGDGADIPEQKANAIGQIWYDRADSKYYKLTGFVGDTPIWAEYLKINGVKRNGTLLTPSSNIVDVNVPTKISDLTNDSDFLTSITKSMVELVLTGTITSHGHNYTTSTDVQTLINTAIASVYKPKGNIANKTALLALTNIKQGDVYNAQASFTLNGQNVKAGDNIVCLSDASTSLETNWDNLGGNIDFAAALSQALVGFSATSGNISSSNTILEAINMLAYDKHTHSNKATLDNITAAFTTALKSNYDTAYTNSHTHANETALDALTQAIITNSHTHSNSTALGNVSGTNTGDETAQRIGTLIDEATEKTTPVDDDMVGLMDSAASKIMKKLSWASIKTKLKAYFDTMYALTGHNHDAVYLGKTAQAVDSDKLDGKHASYFADSSQGAKADTALQSIDKTMVENVLTGVITSHDHNYTTSTDVATLINTAVASVYKPKGNIANKTALLALTNIKQGDVYNAQSAFTLINGQNVQNVKIGDNIVCLADAATSLETNWDNLGGNIDFAAALSQTLIDFSATSGDITSSDTILSAINKLAYDKHSNTYKIFDDSNGVFDANNIFENVSYYVLNSSNKLNRASLPNGLYGDGNVNNSIVSPFWFDSSIIKDNANVNQIKQRIVTSGSSVTGSVDNGSNVISKCYVRVTRSHTNWTPWQRVLTSFDEYNEQPDWNQTNQYQRNYIKNKPDIIAINNEVYNHASLDVITTAGVYPLIYGWEYYKTPNPACGTIPVRSDLEGFLIVYSKAGSISQQIHDTINNIFYIRSFDSESNNWNYWEKIITCKSSYGEQGNSPEVTNEGFDLEQESPVNTFYNIDTSQDSKDLTIYIPLDNVDTYLRNNGPDIGEFKITLMFSSPISNPTLSFGVSSSSVISTTYTVNGTDPSGLSNISGLEIIIKWYNMGWGILFAVYKVNIL